MHDISNYWPKSFDNQQIIHSIAFGMPFLLVRMHIWKSESQVGISRKIFFKKALFLLCPGHTADFQVGDRRRLNRSQSPTNSHWVATLAIFFLSATPTNLPDFSINFQFWYYFNYFGFVFVLGIFGNCELNSMN